LKPKHEISSHFGHARDTSDDMNE